MRICDLNIKSFGRFQQKHIELAPGINLIYGENESGKSTIHTFLKGCFYGIRKMRGKAAKTDIYTKYLPWENPAWYAGSIRFECGGKIFRLDRDFSKHTQPPELVCESDGELLSIEDGDLDVLLGGVGEKIFENTVYIPQLKAETNEGLAEELQNYMVNSQTGRDAALNVPYAVEQLRRERKELMRVKNRQESETAGQLKEYEIHSRYLGEEIQQDKKKLDNCQRELEKLKAEKDVSQKIQDDWRTQENKKLQPNRKNSENHSEPSMLSNQAVLAILFLDFLAILALMNLSLFPMENQTIRLAVGITGSLVLFAAAVLWIVRRRKRKSFYRELEAEAIVDEPEQPGRSGQSGQIEQKLLWTIEQLRQEINENTIAMENLMEEEEMLRQEAELTQIQEIEALELAEATIGEIAKGMHTGIGKRLKMRTSEIFSGITENRYTMVQLDEGLKPGVHTKERYIPLEMLSRGTMEQLYFSLRMAAAEILCQEEPLPIILDDAFVMYDELRLGQTLQWVSKQNRQVLLFTCQDREEKVMRRNAIKFSKINLENPL